MKELAVLVTDPVGAVDLAAGGYVPVSHRMLYNFARKEWIGHTSVCRLFTGGDTGTLWAKFTSEILLSSSGAGVWGRLTWRVDNEPYVGR